MEAGCPESPEASRRQPKRQDSNFVAQPQSVAGQAILTRAAAGGVRRRLRQPVPQVGQGDGGGLVGHGWRRAGSAGDTGAVECGLCQECAV